MLDMHDIHRFPLYSSAVLRDFRRASAERVVERNLRALPILTIIGENSLDFIPWWCETLSQGFSYSLDGSSDSILLLNPDTLRLVQFIHFFSHHEPSRSFSAISRLSMREMTFHMRPRLVIL